MQRSVVVIGAGVGGLTSAIALALAGAKVTVVDAANAPGGKLREARVGTARLDAGPTVLTMRWVFDALFDKAGSTFDTAVALKRASVLARHAWSDTERLDLFADRHASADAIARLSSPAEAKRYLAFCDDAKAVFDMLDPTFIRRSQPSPLGLVGRIGAKNIGPMVRSRPLMTMWGALGRHFKDPRLRQLFGRYATYCGASPYQASATLLLVAHVEQEGVWLIKGGMYRLAEALESLGVSLGVTYRYNAHVERIETRCGRAVGVAINTGDADNLEILEADAIVANCDASAFAAGLFGDAVRTAAPAVAPHNRSLSAMTFALKTKTSGFSLSHHNVFFSTNYRAEFDDIFTKRQMPTEPTVYVCAQDRDDDGTLASGDAERLLCLINAPADGDHTQRSLEEIRQCKDRTFRQMARCGLEVDHETVALTVATPEDFNLLSPATGGALYGQASHGWMASFRRPGARTPIPGLYLAGGSVHPGPGVPMAALSGQQAAAQIARDLALTPTFHPAAMPGGTWTG